MAVLARAEKEAIAQMPLKRTEKSPAKKKANQWRVWVGAVVGVMFLMCISIHWLTIWETHQLRKNRERWGQLWQQVVAIRVSIEERLAGLAQNTPNSSAPPTPLVVRSSKQKPTLIGRR